MKSKTQRLQNLQNASTYNKYENCFGQERFYIRSRNRKTFEF